MARGKPLTAEQIEQLRLKWEEGILTNVEVCRLFKISRQYLHTLRTKHGWTRCLPGEVRKDMAALAEPVHSVAPLTAEQQMALADRRRAVVNRNHQDATEELRDSLTKLVDAVSNIVDSLQDDSTSKAAKNKLKLATQALGSLSKSMERTIRMERKIHRLDEPEDTRGSKGAVDAPAEFLQLLADIANGHVKRTKEEVIVDAEFTDPARGEEGHREGGEDYRPAQAAPVSPEELLRLAGAPPEGP